MAMANEMIATAPSRVDAILEFWFGAGEAERRDRSRLWFGVDPAFDQACTTGFLADHERADAGAFDDWGNTPRGALALILLFDQFPRNMFRGTARAFATDHKALALAQQMIANGFDRRLSGIERSFVYLPFEHSEELAVQQESVRLFRALERDDPSMRGHVDYAERHLAVIERFGRFPHRNAILGRRSTPEEVQFLASKPTPF